MNDWRFVSGEKVNSINHLEVQKVLLETENTFQIEGDVISVGESQKKESVQSTSHTTFFPQMVDPSSEALQPQNINLLSMLLPAEKGQAQTATSGLSLRSNNVDSGNLHAGMCGIDLTQEIVNVHQNLHNSQQIGIDAQQHYVLTQNQPTLACLNSQITQPEKFLGGIYHDPQLNINQQQYLLSELHLQPLIPGVPEPQSSLLNNMLQLRQQEQQQQYISQSIPHDRSMQQLYDSSHGTIHTSLSSGDRMKLCLQRTEEILDLALKLPGHGKHNLQLHASVKLRETGNIGLSESCATALPLPHEMMGHAAWKECSASLTQGSAVVDALSQKESIVDSPSKKTPSYGFNDYSKMTVFEVTGFPQPFQGLQKPKSVASHISNEVHEMDISSVHPHSWKPTPGVRAKSVLEIQAEERLETQREIALENTKVTTTTASGLSIHWVDLVETSGQQFGDQARPMCDKKNGNISQSNRSHLHDLLAREELIKSNANAGVIINSADDTSFPPLAPSITQSDAHIHDGADFIEFKGTRKISNRGKKPKGSAVKTPASHANVIPGPATDPAQVREPCSLRNIQVEEEQESANLQQLVPASSHAKGPMDQHIHGNNSSWQGSESPPSRGNELLKMTSHVSSHSTPNSEEYLFWEPREHAKQDKYVLNYGLNFVSFSSFFLLMKKWTFLLSLYPLEAKL